MFRLGDCIAADSAGRTSEDVGRAISELLEKVDEEFSPHCNTMLAGRPSSPATPMRNSSRCIPSWMGAGGRFGLSKASAPLNRGTSRFIARKRGKMVYRSALDTYYAEGDLGSLVDFRMIEPYAAKSQIAHSLRLCGGSSQEAPQSKSKGENDTDRAPIAATRSCANDSAMRVLQVYELLRGSFSFPSTNTPSCLNTVAMVLKNILTSNAKLTL